jgi:hypothetical protein
VSRSIVVVEKPFSSCTITQQVFAVLLHVDTAECLYRNDDWQFSPMGQTPGAQFHHCHILA